MHCLDTYALVEIRKQNHNYEPITKKPFVIPDLVLCEFWLVLYKNEGERTAEYEYRQLLPFSKKIDPEIVKEALKFRSKHKRNLSFFDCIGYVFALANKLKFVTGDKEFRNLPNVVFIK